MRVLVKNMVPLALFFLILSACSVFCFPAKPLNERSTELAWQAWLLVDDQNQSKQNDSQGILRRRITPKSVFVAPAFSPESLPACAEGYRSDSMGRCIKIIKLDEDAHLDFLLQKLNAKFGDNEDYEDEVVEDISTGGPFQLNIPLNEETRSEEEEGGADIAIVVAPTGGGFDRNNDSVKVDVKRSNQTENSSGNTVKVNTIAHLLEVRQDQQGTTIVSESSTTTDSSTPTTVQNSETSDTTTTVFTDSTVYTDTTVDQSEDAMLINQNTESQRYYTDHDVMLNDEGATTAYPTPTTVKSTQYNTQSTTNFETTMFPEATESVSRQTVRFPDDIKPEESSIAYVKFPDKQPQDHVILGNLPDYPEQYHNTRDTSRQISDHLGEYVDERSEENLRHKDHHAFEYGHPREDTRYRQHIDYGVPHHVYSHRSRERHNDLFTLPPSIRDGSYSSQQKPLVLRFSRKHGFLDMNSLKNPEFYRQVNAEDLSNLFGLRARQFGHR